METQQQMEMQLWDFIDGDSSAAEKNSIEKRIAENAEWKAKYYELLKVHQLINAADTEHPSMRFTKNVMEQIAKHQIAPATKTYINNKIIWGIGLFFLTMIAGFLIYGIAQIDWSSANDPKSNLGVDLSKIDYSKIFSNDFVNIFMMMNVLLGLVLLDRYLSNKKKRLVKETAS